jgi:hypothetical protein
MGNVELDELRVATMVDGVIGREWRHRCVHEAWLEN